MTKVRLRWLLCLLLTGAGPALADDLPDCIDPQDQYSMTYCAGVDYDNADADLNALWPEAVAAAKRQDEYIAEDARSRGVPTAFEALRTAQRAWLKFRDAECEYQSYAFFGGTGQSMVGSACLAQLTRDRIDQLREGLTDR
ncbi:MAG: lysozyme inhibitor LprI family protein [Hoeflea sp.]|uniref:lysozyme inhibitor LprI family protein n=1 Tax=Hoeflea sp. TaxID=1940281 RepID=UPI0032988C92